MTTKLDDAIKMLQSDKPESEKIEELTKLMYPKGRKPLAEAKVGDIVVVHWVRSYQHSAYVEIVKVNRKTVVGYEVKGSYGSGTRWVLHKDWDGATVDVARTERFTADNSGSMASKS